MLFEDYNFILEDRISKIRAINEQYDLENFGYLSFSGGKDSCVLHYLLDLALPGNTIPRLFINTGVEMGLLLRYVKELAKVDNRIIIVNSGVNIKSMLNTYGYPFKNKPFSHNYSIFSNQGKDCKTYQGMIKSAKFGISKALRPMFDDNYHIDFKISDKCCYKLKKEPAHRWQLQNGKSIVLTGMQQSEGGFREGLTCTVFDKENNLIKFHPLAVVTDEWEDMFIKENNILLCELYYPPYNLKRSGCVGCPYSKDLNEQLDMMNKEMPNEYKRSLILWKPVYDEYKKLNYRLSNHKQLSIFDFIEE